MRVRCAFVRLLQLCAHPHWWNEADSRLENHLDGRPEQQVLDSLLVATEACGSERGRTGFRPNSQDISGFYGPILVAFRILCFWLEAIQVHAVRKYRGHVVLDDHHAVYLRHVEDSTESDDG